ncbi:MAG: Rrf2 family transcriptional regulator [Acidobacteria bacterium]|nr:Rrf2 family transcriptional regulator [Acidobacteriota bacterium]
MLPLSQTAGYAVLALSCLKDPGGDPTLVQDVADRTGIPKPYLSKLMNILGRKGIVKTKRGNQGGVVLSRSAGEISLDQIQELVEGTGWREECVLGLSHCSDERACPAHEFWKGERERIFEVLRGITLAEVAAFEQSTRSERLKDALKKKGV